MGPSGRLLRQRNSASQPPRSGDQDSSNHWLRDTSPLLHIAPVPAADPNWTAATWLVGLGLLVAALGTAAFGRRDAVGA
jgi:putative exporter of polyketide antibiotics